MRKFHLIVALLAFGTFGLTGLYMRFPLGQLRDLDPALQVFYRSRHIYILLAALVHGGLGAYLRPAMEFRRLQVFGSVLITASTAALVVAFFLEGETAALRSPVSTLAIYALPLGVGLHVLTGWRNR